MARLLAVDQDEAKALKDEYVSVEHLLLAMIADERSAAARLPQPLGLTRERLLTAIRKIRGSQRVTSPNPERAIKRSRATAVISPSWRGRANSIQ